MSNNNVFVRAFGVRSDSYACPGCLKLQARYKLLKDYNGVSRLVDVSDYPCPECVAMIRKWEDDHK